MSKAQQSNAGTILSITIQKSKNLECSTFQNARKGRSISEYIYWTGYANPFGICLRKKSERNEEKSLLIGRARVPTWEISSLRLTNWAWLRLQVLANRYSNKVPRGWVARCGDEFFIHPRRTLIKTRRVSCTPSRRRKGNSLRIKITLERERKRRALVIFRRGWFIRSGGFVCISH